MSNIAIKVDNLSKLYEIGVRRNRHDTLRDHLVHGVKSLFSRNGRTSTHTIWALRDVSFEIKHGEVVGFIGKNGAGKSTLLKILSRITEPTGGRVEIYGRVGSLLEVGTGFHGELTGRENVYLNGAILGMHKWEIDKKFDEIVAFSEIEKFIDTPVKRYSSGMYVRLAFAVAAHLEPEVLIIDEALSVGDMQFQKKCVEKMAGIAKEGRTVLFVTHNMTVVKDLCLRAVLLIDGKKVHDGPSREVIGAYLPGGERQAERVWNDPTSAPGSESVRLHAVRIVCENEVAATVDIQKDVRIEIEFWNFQAESDISSSIHLLDKMGVEVLASGNMHSANLAHDEWFGRPHPAGLFQANCVLPGNFLNDGRYSVNVILVTDMTRIECLAKEVVSFVVHDTGEMRKEYKGLWIGVVRPRLAWQTRYVGCLKKETV